MGTDWAAELGPRWQNVVLILSWATLAKSAQCRPLRGSWQYAVVQRMTRLCLDGTWCSCPHSYQHAGWCWQAPVSIKVLHVVTRLFDATLIFHLTLNYLMSKPHPILKAWELRSTALNTAPQAGWGDKGAPGEKKRHDAPRDDGEKGARSEDKSRR